MILFLALCFVAMAIAGATAFQIFWPLTLVHVRDRHAGIAARFGAGAFLKPEALGWLLSGRYREVRDAQFTGLATPARVSAFVILGAVLMSALLWLWWLAFR